MSGIYSGIGTEFLKIRRSFVWWLVVLGAAFMPAFVSFISLTEWKHLIPQPGHNPWQEYAQMSWKGMGFLYTPMFIVLLICLYLNIEHKNNAWKNVFTLPVTKRSIYLNKLILLIILLIIFYILFIPFWVISGYFAGIIRPQLQMLDFSPDLPALFNLCFHSFIASLAVLSIHFWLSIRIRNMIIPIAIAVVSAIVWIALFQGKSAAITWFAYSFNYSTISPPFWVPQKMFWIFPVHEMVSLIYFVLFSFLSFFDFTRNFKG